MPYAAEARIARRVSTVVREMYRLPRTSIAAGFLQAAVKGAVVDVDPSSLFIPPLA
jgi:hypothetical protein